VGRRQERCHRDRLGVRPQGLCGGRQERRAVEDLGGRGRWKRQRRQRRQRHRRSGARGSGGRGNELCARCRLHKRAERRATAAARRRERIVDGVAGWAHEFEQARESGRDTTIGGRKRKAASGAASTALVVLAAGKTVHKFSQRGEEALARAKGQGVMGGLAERDQQRAPQRCPWARLNQRSSGLDECAVRRAPARGGRGGG
jgi:hypothetical protein